MSFILKFKEYLDEHGDNIGVCNNVEQGNHDENVSYRPMPCRES